jgi:exodeoxyribonuclease-3
MTTSWQAPLIPAPAIRHEPATGLLRLMVFNAQHAAPERARRQVAWIAAQEAADIVVITEVGPGPGGRAIPDALREHGYESIHGPTPGVQDYGALLASRGTVMEAIPSPVSVLSHRAPAAIVTVAQREIGLLGLYVPSRGPKDRRNQDKRAFQDAVSQSIPHFLDHANGPVIAAGDLNVVEPGHVPHYKVFGQWEYDFYQSFADAGMSDAYRARHPAGTDHSWLGRGGNGYRFDHVFITRDHTALIQSCRYHHEPRRMGLSDHAAIEVTVDLSVRSREAGEQWESRQR